MVLRVTGDADGAMTAGQQAFELAAALGDSALQAQAAHYLGQAYHAIGDFRRAAELLRRNVEAADRESGTLSADVRLQSQAWLARTLSALGAFAEGRRHGEEALRLATLEGRGGTPIIAHAALGELYLAQGDLEHAIQVSTRAWPSVVPLATGLFATDRGGPGLCLCAPGAPRGGARAGGGGDQRRSPHGRAAKSCPAGSHGSARSVVWRDAPMRPRSTRARRSTWPGSSKARGDEAHALHQLGAVQAHADPPDAVQAEAYYQQALALAEELGMRPLQAHCHRGLGTLYATTGQREQAHAELSTAIDTVPRDGHDLLAAAGGGGTGAGGGAVMDF